MKAKEDQIVKKKVHEQLRYDLQEEKENLEHFENEPVDDANGVRGVNKNFNEFEITFKAGCIKIHPINVTQHIFILRKTRLKFAYYLSVQKMQTENDLE